MPKLFTLTITLLFVLKLSFANLYPLEYLENPAARLLSFVSDDHSGWKLLSGNAKIDETVAYLGQQSLVLDGSDGGTVLSCE